MLPRIHRLENNLVNRIAAGEVVERPASALKELVENSIDAHATKIIVELIDGGIKLIKIIDNGYGIHKDDLELAVDRHTTSKLEKEDDLYSIATLGFRGEGLASIASISDFTLSSKIKDAEYGYKISSNYGILSQIMPTPMNNGTVIEVRNIYHTIPARKKFLKAETTEYGHCKSIFERLALSNPQINFELKHNQKEILNLKEQSLLLRIQSLFGDSYTKSFFEVLENQANGLSLSGYLYHPSYLESNKTVQQFYINGRFVRDKVIQNAIKQGFSGVLHHEHQPCYILFLEINPGDIDINVHPTKNEVRFKDSGQIHGFISGVVKKYLSNNSFATTSENNSLFTNSILSKEIDRSTTKIAISPKKDYKNQYQLVDNTKFTKNWLNRDVLSEDKKVLITPEIFINSKNVDNHSDQLILLGCAIGQLNGVYILSQVKDGLIIVDIHAAHERILLEQLKEDWINNNIFSQSLLLPISMHISDELQEVVINNIELIKKFGFELELQNGLELVIKSIPALLGKEDIEKLILDTINEMSKYGNTNKIVQHYEYVLSAMACHGAIKANHQLSVEEMNSLLRDMEGTSRASYCNHGRPTWFKITMNELNGMFMRGK